MKVRETQLPGIGIRYDVAFDEGGEFVVVLHNDGDREAFWRAAGDADGEKLFEASESEAHRLAEILDGTYFQPVGPDLERVFDESRVRWVQVPAGSPAVGRTIAGSQLRSEAGVSVLAVQRGDGTVPNPGGEETIRADDVLVVVGSEDEHEALERLLSREEPGEDG